MPVSAATRRGDIVAEEVVQRLFALRRQRTAQGHFHQPEQRVFFREDNVDRCLAHGVLSCPLQSSACHGQAPHGAAQSAMESAALSMA